MNHPVRFLTVLAALGLLVAVFAASGPTTVQAAVVDIDDGDVEWASMEGDAISFVKADIDAVFLINDDDLNNEREGKAVFTGVPAGTKYLVLAGVGDTLGADGMTNAASTTMMMLDEDTEGYVGAETPLVTGVLDTTISGNFPLSVDPNGTITLLSPIEADETDLTVDFKFHLAQDVYDGHLRDVVPATDDDPEKASDAPADTRRAKVTSTSDPQGEWVTIREVAGADDHTAAATSNMFLGTVSLDGGASSSGTDGWCTQARIDFDEAASAGSRPCRDLDGPGWADGGVWVQDGDTLTVTYYDDESVVLDTHTVTVDTVAPQIINIKPEDGSFSRVANPTVTFDVIDAGSGIDIGPGLDNIELFVAPAVLTSSGLDSSGNKAPNVSFQGVTDGVRVIYADRTSWSTVFGVSTANGGAFPIVIRAKDRAGNEATVPSDITDDDTTYTIDVDLDKPTVRTAATGSANTKVVVNFDEPLDADSVDGDGSDFTVDGATVTAAARLEDDDDTDANEETMVELTVTALEPDAKPLVKVVGAVADRAGNEVDVDNDNDSQVTASDAIPATISSINLDRDLTVKDDEVAITLGFDEKLATEGVAITVIGPDGKGNTLSSSRPTPLVAEASIKIGTSGVHPTGMYGVSVQVTDLGSNTTDNLTDVKDEVPSLGDSDADDGVKDTKLLTVDEGPIGDKNFDGDIDKDDVTVLDTSIDDDEDTDVDERALEVASVDASERTITLRSNFDAGEDAKKVENLAVTYAYAPAGSTFQVDHSAPTVTFDPADEETVKDQSPFIRIVFDENEYPGDGYKTVTLDKAELTGPDGTVTDVKENFLAGSADNIEFIWAASELALGDYTLTVSATDSAGNMLEDASADFTIAKRTAEIDLRPGWNLISIPGSLAPDKRGINDVFTLDAVDIVLTYDARKRNWYRATRQDDGTLGQPGSSLELTRISSRTAYWVHSTGVVEQAVDLMGASSQEPPVSIDLVAGWNLIPVRTQDVGSDPTDADSYFSGLKWTRAYGYNNTTQVFEAILPGTLDDSEDLVEGKGYWVYVQEAGVLVP